MEINEILCAATPIRQEVYCGRARNILIGETKSPLRGIGEDIHDIKEWEPGEPLENVDLEASLPNWPEKIFLLEMLETKQAPVIMLADISPSMFVEFEKETGKFGLMLSIIASLGLGAYGRHDPVGFLSFSDEVEFFLSPRLNIRWLTHGLELLLDAATVIENYLRQKRTLNKTSDLNGALNFLLTRLRRQQCAIVILSDFADIINGRSRLNFDLIELLTATHNWNLTALFLEDAREFSWTSRWGLVRIRDIETGESQTVRASRAAKIRKEFCERREVLRRRLRDCGVDSTVLSCGDHFNELAQFLSERQSAVFR